MAWKTPEKHYQEAEKCLGAAEIAHERAGEFGDEPRLVAAARSDAAYFVAKAQVHATLATLGDRDQLAFYG